MKFSFSFLRVKRVAREDELAPGVTKPTTILATMIAADLMTKGVTRYRSLASSKSVLFLEEERKERPADYDYRRSLYEPKWSTLKGTHYEIRACERSGTDLNYITVSVPGVTFSEAEKTLILEALKKGLTFEDERVKVKKDGESQQAAVTAIEKFMGLGKLAKLAKPETEDDYSLNAGRR